jgi:protein SCO1/2
MKRHRLELLGSILATALAAGTAQAAPRGSPWGESYFPNVPLVTHDGRTVRFYDDLVRDRRVVVSFIFTRCKKQCGLITANLARVQRELGDKMGKEIQFYSITLDPERDTPEVLARYREAFHAGPGWTFLTGAKADIDLLRAKFGEMGAIEDHAAALNVGNDATGQWWHPAAIDNPRYLAILIGNYMDPKFRGTAASLKRSYADAPPIAPPSKGQTIFARQCAMCHLEEGKSVGPDLRGVAALRDRAWLARWLKAPEKVIAEKDPLALELLARANGVVMPDQALSDADVAEVIGHLETMARPALQPSRAP